MTSPDAVLDKCDPGDDVASRFDYQHCYAAINAVRLIVDATNVAEIICENHEDFLIKTPTGKFIGTQIKTRLPTLPAFKASDDPVQKALAKFCILDKQFPGEFDKFDFTTNHSFWDEKQTFNNLPWLLESLKSRGHIKNLRANNPLRSFVEQLVAATGLTATEVVATLGKTVIRGHASDISHIRSSVREALSQCPGVEALPYATVAKLANDLVDVARDASIKTLKGPITDLYKPGTNLEQIIDGQHLSGKKICKDDVLALIHQYSEGRHYQDLDLAVLISPSDVPSDIVRAVRKLAKGGVETGRVTNIEDRIRSFEALFIEWSRKYGPEEASKRYNNILAVVQFEAAEAQATAEKGGEPYGSAMYATLADRLMSKAKSDPDQVYRCRPEHLMGAAGVLTQKCKTWWSSKFDASGGTE